MNTAVITGFIPVIHVQAVALILILVACGSIRTWITATLCLQANTKAVMTEYKFR